VVRTFALGVTLALSVSACTVLCPTVGVIRGSMNADVVVDEHGCEHAPDGTTRVPCTRPGPVLVPRTIAENALVGLLVDAAMLVILSETDGY
jgi:hypothetical protein